MVSPIRKLHDQVVVFSRAIGEPIYYDKLNQDDFAKYLWYMGWSNIFSTLPADTELDAFANEYIDNLADKYKQMLDMEIRAHEGISGVHEYIYMDEISDSLYKAMIIEDRPALVERVKGFVERVRSWDKS